MISCVPSIVNYGSIWYHFRDKARYWLKILQFLYTLLHSTPRYGVPIEIHMAITFGKLEWCVVVSTVGGRFIK